MNGRYWDGSGNGEWKWMNSNLTSREWVEYFNDPEAVTFTTDYHKNITMLRPMYELWDDIDQKVPYPITL